MIRIPRLTRLDRKKDESHGDLDIYGTLSILENKKTRFSRRFSLFDLFCFTYDQEDAAYRGGFLSDLVDDSSYMGGFRSVFREIPTFYLSFIYQDDENGWPEEWSDERTPIKVIKRQIDNARKYLSLPRILEKMADHRGSSQAARELARFGFKARKDLADYEPMATGLLPRFDSYVKAMDIVALNSIIESIMPFAKRLEHLSEVKKEMRYYLQLSHPFRASCNGKMVPSCKVQFLDPENRQGHMIEAYHPSYFAYHRKSNDFVIDSLNVPNDIHWGNDARHNYIQGPNDHGKSVYMKTIGLNVHLAMATGRCFAESCEISPIRMIFPCYDLGDILGKGHFVAGAEKVRYMAENVTRDDLVLLDEAGGGTEPAAERLIAKGIFDALAAGGITFFGITHDKRVWHNYKCRRGVRYLRVADLDDNKDKYKVWEGIAKSGYAMRKAAQLGIDPTTLMDKIGKNLE